MSKSIRFRLLLSLRLRALYAVFFAALAACASPTTPALRDSTTAALAVIDAYQLHTHNGSALPWQIASGPTSTTFIVDGAISLQSGDVWTRVMTQRIVTANGESFAHMAQSGTYTTSLRGRRITFRFTPEGGGAVFFNGLLMGNTLVFSPMANGSVMAREQWIYRR